ncbi:MAG: hypothetical protein LBI69_00450 [Puniceicoccales bacterium]|nr:hypothetical protein [Puniceicoccales bacterium]
MKEKEKNRKKPAKSSSSLCEFLVIFFWEHGKKVMWGAMVLLALISAICLGFGWNAFCRHRMEKEFIAAVDRQDRLQNFAQRYHRQPLGIFASLLLLNHSTVEQCRESSLKIPHLAGIAMLSSAIGKAQCQHGEEALHMLESLGNDDGQPSIIRAAAMYHQAVIYHEKGIKDQKMKAIEGVHSLPFSGIWGEKAAMLAAAPLAADADS